MFIFNKQDSIQERGSAGIKISREQPGKIRKLAIWATWVSDISTPSQFSSSSIGACDVTQTNETVISDRQLKTDLQIFEKTIFN